jgi:hypothetical protein
MTLKGGGFGGLGKRRGKSVRVCWTGNRRVMETSQVAGMRWGDEQAEVGEGSRDIRLGVGHCPERADFVPR